MPSKWLQRSKFGKTLQCCLVLLEQGEQLQVQFLSDLKIWKPTQQYKTCPSVVDSSPNFFFFLHIYQSVLAVVLSKTKLAYSSTRTIFFFQQKGGEECLYCVSIAFLKEMTTSFKSEIESNLNKGWENTAIQILHTQEKQV